MPDFSVEDFNDGGLSDILGALSSDYAPVGVHPELSIFAEANTSRGAAASVASPEARVERPTTLVGSSSTDAVAGPSTKSPLTAPLEQGVSGSAVGLLDLVRALLSDSDSCRLAIQIEVRSLLSFLATMVDALLNRGLPLEQFRLFLDPRIALIRSAGYPELAQAFTEDISRLEVQLQCLRELEVAGPSSYGAAEVEARVSSWRNNRAVTEMVIQLERDRTQHLRASAAEVASTVNRLQSRVSAGADRVKQLEEELQVEKESLNALVLEKTNKEQASSTLLEQLEVSEQGLAKLEEEASKTLSTSEESFRAELREELQKSYYDKVSELKQQLHSHRFDV